MKRFKITPGAVAFLCFLFYVSEMEVFFAFLLLSVLHELGHLAAMLLLGVEVLKIRVGVLGTVISTAPMPLTAEIFCSLAGPIVNLFCFWVLRPCQPGAALISLLLACYNLLPVYPLDGGRALRGMLYLCLPIDVADKAEGMVMLLFLGAMALAVWQLSIGFGWMPLLIYAALILHVVLERNYCCDSMGFPV